MTVAEASAWRSRGAALLCAGLLLAAMLLSYPVAEIGICDDWSYIRSARLMAETGHFLYIGWASAMLGWMLPLGSAFVRAFGFSFTAVRASVMLVSLLTAFVLHRCFVRMGLKTVNATLATLCCVLSPVFLPLATSYMTDVPGVLAVFTCLYCCLRALDEARNGVSAGWLAAACVLTALGGTARQTAWLALYIMVPSAAFLLRGRRLPWIPLGLLWIASCGFTDLCLRWFSHQPYSLGEALMAGYIDRDLIFGFAGHVTRALLKGSLLIVPVTVVFVPLLRKQSRALRWTAVALAGWLVFYGLQWRLHHLSVWLAPFDGNYFTEHGLVDMPEIGLRPVMLQPWVRVLITAATLLSTSACLALLVASWRGRGRALAATPTGEQLRRMAILQVPYAAVYLLLVMHRALFSQFFDRYWIALSFVPLSLLLLWFQGRVAPRLPALCVVAVAAVGIFSIAANHDMFALERARVRATQELIAAGVPRDHFYGGWEYDGWTQVDRYGFANSGTMHLPHGYAVEPPIPLGYPSKPCNYWAAHMAAAVRPRFAVSFDDASCAGPARLPPVSYSLWLPPFHGALFIRHVATP